MSNNFQKQLENLEKRVSRLEEAVGKPTTKTSGAQSGDKKGLSLREFLISKKPADDVQKTLAIGYYLESYRGFTSFNIADLQAGYENAKEKKPPNINDKVNLNIRKGHMAEASAKKDSKKAWYVTNSGEQFVENSFSNEE
jgi:hypothetical protein